MLLESFVDPSDVKFLQTSEDPVPNFHNLLNNYSSGYLKVPVVGAGTANTEFEVLTGMSMQYFGTGEYPYKTKKSTVAKVLLPTLEVSAMVHMLYITTVVTSTAVPMPSP